MNGGVDTEHNLHCTCKSFFHSKNFADFVSEFFGSHFNVNVESIVIVNTVNNNLIVGIIALVKKNCFNLAGEYVNTSDDEHIVCSAHGLCHLDEGSAAGALFT